MEWLLLWINSTCGCFLLVTAEAPLLLLAIDLEPSYIWDRQCSKMILCFRKLWRIKFLIIAPVGLPCICTDSENVSWMIGFSCSKLMYCTLKSRISLLAFQSVTSSAIAEKKTLNCLICIECASWQSRRCKQLPHSEFFKSLFEHS